MRKGFSLVEMVALIVVLTLVSSALSSVLVGLLNDIPEGHRAVQTNTSVLSMLKQMQADVDRAKQLPESFAGRAASEELLLIETPGGCICYKLQDDEVFRYRLWDAQQGTGEDSTVWPVPSAKVEWRVWRKNGKGYAVEFKTYIEYRVAGHRPQKKLANSHLYFVGAL